MIERQERSRLALYRLLSLALYEPSSALDALLTNEAACSELEQAAGAVAGPAGVRAVREMIEGRQSASQLDLVVEYNRLFVGPASPPCPPYQSVYDLERPAADRGTMLGPTVEAMEKKLRAEGLGVTLDHAEMADHAAIELELMWYLLTRAAESEDDTTANEYAARAQEVFDQHLAPWIGAFGSCVAREAQQPFYRAAARLLEQVMQAEAIQPPV